jgi:integrase/recombinase XerD
MYNIRPKLLALSGKVSQALFINAGKGTAYHNIAHAIITKLKEQNPGFTDMRQIRASVISNWLKVHNIRKVQYMAGHRYISATERYKANNMEELINDVERFHPLG